MNQKNALVTGLNGFTGRYMAKDLERSGYVVHGLSDLAHNLTNSYQVNLLDKGALTRAIEKIQPTVVVHLAAVAFVGHRRADDFYQVNLIGTRNLLEALETAKVSPECVLLVSSANVYGNVQNAGAPIDEAVLPRPANDYAVSKLAMEYMASLWANRLPIVTVRPFNYSGVGQSLQFLLPKIVAHFRRREKSIELGNIDVERDFSDVRFVTDTYLRILQKAPTGQLMNVCSGSAWSLRRILAMMAEIAGYEIEIRINPSFVRTTEVQRLQGDPGKLEKLVGELRRIPLEDTLRWMYSEDES